jgi:hypothetical protein
MRLLRNVNRTQYKIITEKIKKVTVPIVTIFGV